MLGVVYAFVVIVDPWGALPLSPPLPRVPISSNARFSFPTLARDPAFDSALIGTSTTRLLRPAVLDGLLGGRFVNLAMNASAAWEEDRILAVFMRSHPQARMVVIGMDMSWCTPMPDQQSGRAFPTWMYDEHRWAGYADMATLYAVQEAYNQLTVMLGIKRLRYGLDGYTRFVPDDRFYDPARVAAAFAAWPVVPNLPAPAMALPEPPALGMLSQRLAALGPQTRVILFFTPNHISQQGESGSAIAALWSGCKQAVVRRAKLRPGTMVIDFMVRSDVTRDTVNYWDPLHYRTQTADRIMAELAEAVEDRPLRDGVVLVR